MSRIEQIREHLISDLKTTANELIARAEEIVGENVINLSDMSIHIYLNTQEATTYDVDKSFVTIPIELQ